MPARVDIRCSGIEKSPHDDSADDAGKQSDGYAASQRNRDGRFLYILISRHHASRDNPCAAEAIEQVDKGSEERTPSRTPPIKAGFSILESFMKCLPVDADSRGNKSPPWSFSDKLR